MRRFLLLCRREWAACFLSPVAYVVLVFFLLMMGFSFWMMADMLAGSGGPETVMSEFFGSIFFWLAVLVVSPFLTMRLFAEERRSGTFEVLMTAPVGTPTVVLAKFFGALGVYVTLWLPTLLYVVLLHSLTAADAAPPDYRILATGYLGAFLVGMFFISVGVLTSAFTRNQIVAAMSAFALTFCLFLAGFLPYLSRQPWVQQMGAYASPVVHMLDFARGVVDTRALAFYGVNTGLALFLTVRVVEAGRWR